MVPLQYKYKVRLFFDTFSIIKLCVFACYNNLFVYIISFCILAD